MEKETYKMLEVLEQSRNKIQNIFNRTGYDSLVDEKDFILIEENLNKINSSIFEIKKYSRGGKNLC